MTLDTIWRKFGRRIDLVLPGRYNKCLSPNVARATFTTYMLLLNELDERRVQYLLGHNDGQSTAYYVRLLRSELAALAAASVHGDPRQYDLLAARKLGLPDDHVFRYRTFVANLPFITATDAEVREFVSEFGSPFLDEDLPAPVCQAAAGKVQMAKDDVTTTSIGEYQTSGSPSSSQIGVTSSVDVQVVLNAVINATTVLQESQNILNANVPVLLNLLTSHTQISQRDVK